MDFDILKWTLIHGVWKEDSSSPHACRSQYTSTGRWDAFVSLPNVVWCRLFTVAHTSILLSLHTVGTTVYTLVCLELCRSIRILLQWHVYMNTAARRASHSYTLCIFYSMWFFPPIPIRDKDPLVQARYPTCTHLTRLAS